jgi:hypothetical protein
MSASTPDEWWDALTGAFRILLGRPLTEFDPDASYDFYYCCPAVTDTLFGFNESDEHLPGFDAEALARGDIVDPPFLTIPGFQDHIDDWDAMIPQAGWSYDLGRSVYRESEPGAGTQVGVPGLAAGLQGTELGRILIERQLTPTHLKPARPIVSLRVPSDGSLFGAMCAATATQRGPGHYFDPEMTYGFDPGWEQRLAAVTYPGLRDHLSHLCRTEDMARADGAYYSGRADAKEADRLAESVLGSTAHGQVIASWEFGEGHATSAVVQAAR